MSALRTMAAQMSDAALEALASRGLVRRALADAAAGKVELRREEDRSAELVVDGETVGLIAEGLAKSSCTCPAPGICRHRLTAVIHLRSAAPAGAATDWRSVFEVITPAAIARFAGKTGWQEALSAEPAPATIEDRGSTLVVQVAEQSVVFLPEGGLPAAITKAPASARKIAIAIAALAARQAFGLPPPDQELAGPQAPVDREMDTAGLVEIRGYLERAWTSAFGFAPMALEDEARRLALSSRAEAAPRLASLLRRIASGIAALRLRNADADPDALLMLLTQAHAVCIALEKQPPEPFLSNLRGVVRQDYSNIGEIELFGLGARRWETASGAHGVTAHFFAPSDGKTYSLTLARGDRTDGQFDPRTAFHQAGIWGYSMARLCTARLKLRNAQASPNGRLSTSAGTGIQMESWSVTSEAIRPWPCAFGDWSRLQSYLQALFAPRLAADRSSDVPVLLVFSRYAPALFDEITQTLSWPLADADGRWIGLTLDYAGAEKDRIAALEQKISKERFWAVLANASLEEDRIALRPYALWGATQQLLDFTAEKTTKDSASILDLLRRFRAGTANGPRSLVTKSPATDAVLGRALNSLLRHAEGGGIPTDAGQLSRDLEHAGFPALARLFKNFAENPGAAAGLRAAYVVVTIQQARSSLGWMR